ncbi:MAG: hypothetical protein JSU70_16240 [Phycisphaerales bacterium]|nr:MAG: hypothetical protein JSU70_16240 [Phycisphaerales bacterium]
MKLPAQNRRAFGPLLAALVLWQSSCALGIILHPDGEPNLAAWTDRPHEDVVGRWGNNASCVAISSNCVITTQHQKAKADTLVEIAGNTYTVSEIWNHDTADLRIARLYGANLASFVGVYESTDEIVKKIVIGGYGNGRGELLQNQGITYGHAWDDSGNTTLRFGTNLIEDIKDQNTVDPFTSDILIADFDGLNEGDSTIYESIPANHDSGSGWFIKVGETWQLAGLSRAVDTHFEEGHEDDPNYIVYEAWFRDRADPTKPRPDYLDAVRLGSYAKWISDMLPSVPPGDLNGDDRVDSFDLAVFGLRWLRTDCQPPDFCLRADSEPDGDVDWLDLAHFAVHWLDDHSIP